ncbi:MAG: DUF2812 domain-containing protein [Bifidobacteriaceae bacterium]|jgi:hypothetical protein|nr:DUF2812 domain-containing protein [Bifidobacteriaceae bacterium]
MKRARRAAGQGRTYRVFTASGVFKYPSKPVFDKHLAPLPPATRRQFYASVMVDPTERWLNEQAAQGWAVVDCGPLRYGFERTEPGQYCVRCEFLPRPYFAPDMQDYLTALVDSGAEVVAVAQDQFLIVRRRAALGPFELFSDLDARIAYADRFRTQARQMAALWAMALGMVAVVLVMVGLDAMLEGQEFWPGVGAFLSTIWGIPAARWFVGLLFGVAAFFGVSTAVICLRLTGEIARLRRERAIHE